REDRRVTYEESRGRGSTREERFESSGSGKGHTKGPSQRGKGGGDYGGKGSDEGHRGYGDDRSRKDGQEARGHQVDRGFQGQLDQRYDHGRRDNNSNSSNNNSNNNSNSNSNYGNNDRRDDRGNREFERNPPPRRDERGENRGPRQFEPQHQQQPHQQQQQQQQQQRGAPRDDFVRGGARDNNNSNSNSSNADARDRRAGADSMRRPAHEEVRGRPPYRPAAGPIGRAAAGSRSRSIRRRVPQAQERPSKPVKVIILNLPSDMDEAEFKDTASAFGRVTALKLFDSRPKMPRRGWVEYATLREAENAVKELDQRSMAEWELLLSANIDLGR
ncbi:unnamed protein product, partial [Polarella glacialis]